jgi:hypothetical protein
MKVSTTTRKIANSNYSITESNVIMPNKRYRNSITVTKKINQPYYDICTGGLTEDQVSKMPIRGYFPCETDVDSYFAHIVAEWVDDESIKPFGKVNDHYYWGNDDVVFWATKEDLLRIKTEVSEYGYTGQLNCFSWETIKRFSVQNEQFNEFVCALTKEVYNQMKSL